MKISNLKKTYYYLQRNGWKKTVDAAVERVFFSYGKDYSYLPPAEEELLKQREREWENPLLFSILVPAFETKKEYLTRLLDAMVEQTYPHWQLVLADAGKSGGVKETALSYGDSRICYVKLKENRGISENTNQALKYAKGEYIGLLDHDDFLTPDALFEMAAAIVEGREKNRDYVFLYSDEDKCDSEGKTFYEPHWKTDFNLDLLLTNNYICHFLVMKKEWFFALRLRAAYDGAQDFDLVLRAVGRLWKEEKQPEDYICHIPKVLYHWRCHEASTASNPKSKEYAYEAGRRAIQDFCDRRGWSTEVKALPHVGFYKVIYENGIFAQRQDIGALGGKEIRRGKIVESIYDEKGRPLYEGIYASHSGYFHRAVLTQNAAFLDHKKWRLRPELSEKVETFLCGISSVEGRNEEEERRLVCEFLKKEGYRLYWDPDWRL